MARARFQRGIVGMALVLAVAMQALPAAPIAAQDPAAPASVDCLPEAEPNDLAEQAPLTVGDICFEGTLVEKADQDLWFWDVRPGDGLATWTFSVVGVPNATTSVHVIRLTSDDGVFPVTTAGEATRVDSDVTTDEPALRADVQLPPDRYLLGVSRAEPLGGLTLTDDRTYRFSIERRLELPASADAEPNDEATTASPVAGLFEVSGDVGDGHDVLRWSLDEADAARSYRIEARTSLLAPLTVELRTADGQPMAGAQRTQDGSGLVLHDIRLAPGDYLLDVSAPATTAQPYIIRAAEVSDAIADAEPNDGRERAIPLDPDSRSAQGRLAAANDRDDWSFSIDADQAQRQFGVELTTDAPGFLNVCLHGPSGAAVKCRDGNGGLALSNLLLPEGTYTLEVSGSVDLTSGYRLTLVDLGPPTLERELEPNDRAGSPTAWDPELAMTGTLETADDDIYRVTIDGAPELWTVDAAGAGLESVQWIAADGGSLGVARAAADGTSASLKDLYLLPGDHVVRVRGRNGDYRLTLTSQGGPDMDAEREPNDDLTRAQALLVGGHKTGRVANPADIDVFRFSLAAPEHVTLSVDVPEDGAIGLELWERETLIARLDDPSVGLDVVYDARLQPGDYQVWLRPLAPSDADYRFSLERGDQFTTHADLEPNDTVHAARALPASLVVDGSGRGPRGEDDWYALPPLVAGGPIAAHVEGDVSLVGLSDGLTEMRLAPDAATGLPTSPALLADVPYYLRVSATGPYRVRLIGAGLPPAAPDTTLPLTLSLVSETTEVAGFWAESQRVPAKLEVVSTASSDVSLDLDAVASHTSWSVELPSEPPVVPAGATISVPITIVVPADAPTGAPVRVTVRARDAADAAAAAQATAFTEITPLSAVIPVEPTPTWPLPAALLGGMDVASTAQGATVVSAIDPVGEALLHDGYALSGGGFTGIFRGGPFSFTVDLAGDDPAPIAGFILDPLGGDGSLSTRPRRVELQLSADGTAFETVADYELSPVPREQAVVLDSPVDARFARLLLHSSYSGTAGGVSLGEWKVVATPGFAARQEPLNIADPVHGGHVAWMTPQPDSIISVQGMLTEDLTPWRPVIGLRRTIQWVVGFKDDRAARIEQLQWVDPPASEPAIRSSSAEVEVAVASALGPWTSLGTWDLVRAADGSVPPFTLQEPTWARFVRVSIAGPQTMASRWELPATLRILESPTDETYRSVAGQWGRSNPDGIHEILVPPAVVRPNAAAPDAGDSPEAAMLLADGEVVDGRVTRHKDVDWYEVEVPAGLDVLTFPVTQSPGAGVALTLQDAAGQPVRIWGAPTDDPAMAVWSARVSPGRYRVGVEQPELSAAFVFDTSGSMAEYVPQVREALREVVRGIVPGDEVVKLYPFGLPPLTYEWADDPFLLEQAVATGLAVSDSSAAEATMLPAAKSLLARKGTRAMLLLTDAETGSYDRNTDLWDWLDDVRPAMFTVHVGGSGNPDLTTALMQDWARSSVGHYQYAATQSDIDSAFARMTTWLRRPADYHLSWEASNTALPSSRITVRMPLGPGGAPLNPPLSKGVGVALVVDTSLSMRLPLGNTDRMSVARDVLQRLVTTTIPEGVPVSLRTFKRKKASCDSQLILPLRPLQRVPMSDEIRNLRGITRGTPLAATIGAVPGDLAGVSGPKVVIVVTDGAETCGGDPEAAVEALVDAGLEASVSIVGLALDREEVKADMKAWAETGGGTFYDAQDPATLETAIAAVLQAPYRVYDEAGALVATGVVGGASVEVPTGIFRVEVLSDPPVVFEGIDLIPGETAELTLGEDDETS